MAIELVGGCSVSLLCEGNPRQLGTAREWPLFGRATGASTISLRTVQLAPGRWPIGGAACDEVLYVLDGAGSLLSFAEAHELAPGTGFYVPPGARCEIETSGSMTLSSSRCPDPGDDPQPAETLERPAVVRLADCISETTSDRWYRVLLDGRIGSAQVTQFVGAIPPGRAPDHFHEYEEVLCILEGRGRMWAGDRSTPIERGSCIYLPRRQIHCVENTGNSELRLLGVFYPSGSPAVRYVTKTVHDRAP
jgi:mannose-6-phosphate isomerase-like protein (cupin superfamily)